LEELRKYKLLIIDIIHGTTNLASIKLVQISPYLVIGEMVLGTGSVSGAYSLKLYFSDKISEPHLDFGSAYVSLSSNVEFGRMYSWKGLMIGSEDVKPRWAFPTKTIPFHADCV
jgi:hypothetical protein